MALLDEIQKQLRKPCTLLLDESFSDEWELFSELSRRRETYLARLDFFALWPVNSSVTALNTPREQWTIFDKYLHHRENYDWYKNARRAARHSRLIHSLQSIPATKSGYWQDLLGFERYLLWHGSQMGMAGIYLLNKREWERSELVSTTHHLQTARDMCEKLTKKLRQFEGRKWRGFHHHLVLCIMAQFFATKKA